MLGGEPSSLKAIGPKTSSAILRQGEGPDKEHVSSALLE